jgi:hypothetical protein
LNQRTAPIEKLEGNTVAKNTATDEWIADGQAEHKNGIPFYKAPIPSRLHFCTAQTRGFIRGTYNERCACGAFRYNKTIWIERNTARKNR